MPPITGARTVTIVPTRTHGDWRSLRLRYVSEAEAPPAAPARIASAGPPVTLVATDAVTGVLLGSARYLRSSEFPELAELIIRIPAGGRHAGVENALGEALAEHARHHGINTLVGTVPEWDASLLELLANLGWIRELEPEGGLLRFELTL